MSEQSDTTAYPPNTEKIIYDALNQFFYYYLTERNIEHTLASVTEDIFSIGTGNGEIAVGKRNSVLFWKQRCLPCPLPLPLNYQIFMENGVVKIVVSVSAM